MNRIARFSSKVLIILTWLFVGIFFVDSSNLLDIITGNDYVVSHPEDDYLTESPIDYETSIKNDNSYQNTTNSEKFEDAHVRIVKKLIVDWDSLSTNILKFSSHPIITIFENINVALHSIVIIQNSLFLKYCSLLI